MQKCYCRGKKEAQNKKSIEDYQHPLKVIPARGPNKERGGSG
jgi:hypothetical protein